MGQVIDFHSAREVPTAHAPESRCRCGICGADLWHINRSGEVCCADCETVCPYRLQSDAAGRRQAECARGNADAPLQEDDIHA
jgi:hypothetical protein